ncbi:hypothetical protein M422DRAFT_776334 [Sphaerobolus stellatus SS14]|nr:hypothetical protein M422DRAFT_776334 [Sphaerobolus stellatus SS14]
MLPPAIASYVAADYLTPCDASSLARTCRDIHVAVLPVLFHTAIISGGNTNTIGSLQSLISHIIYTRRRIQGLLDRSYLLRLIRHVEIRNWVNYSEVVVDIMKRERGSLTMLPDEILFLWISTYKCLVNLINQLPALQTLLFEERSYIDGTYHTPLPPSLPIDEAANIFGQYYQLQFEVIGTQNGILRLSIPPLLQRIPPPSPRTCLSSRYFLELLQYSSLPVISTRLSCDIVGSLDPLMIHKLISLKKFGVWRDETWPLKPVVQASCVSNIGIILDSATSLENLDLLPSRSIAISEQNPSKPMTNLIVFAGEAQQFCKLSTCARSICLTDSSWDEVPPILKPLGPSYKERIRHLDMTSFQLLTNEQLTQAAEIFPNVTSLVLYGLSSRQWTSTGEAMLPYVFVAVTPFKRLISILIRLTLAGQNFSTIPLELRNTRPNKCLETIKLQGNLYHLWDRYEGWTCHKYPADTILNAWEEEMRQAKAIIEHCFPPQNAWILKKEKSWDFIRSRWTHMRRKSQA